MTAPTTESVSPWDRFFFRPQLPAAMTLVRVGWGATVVAWAISLLPDIDPFFVEGDLMYERQLTDGAWNVLPRLPDGAGLVVCLVMLLAGLLTMVGWRTRASAVVAVLMMIVLQRANTAIFNSGDLLLREVGIALALAPSGLLWSLDARRDRRKGRHRNLWRAPFAQRFLQLALALGYFLSAWSKARGQTWHDGTAMALSMRIEDLERFAAPEWLFDQLILLNLFTWATLTFEATFFALVWNRRLRPYVIGAGVLFHLGIDVFLDIGFFSLAIYLAYLAFLPNDLAERIVGRFDSAALGASEPSPANASGSTTPGHRIEMPSMPALLGVVGGAFVGGALISGGFAASFLLAVVGILAVTLAANRPRSEPSRDQPAREATPATDGS